MPMPPAYQLPPSPYPLKTIAGRALRAPSASLTARAALSTRARGKSAAEYRPARIKCPPGVTADMPRIPPSEDATGERRVILMQCPYDECR